MELGYESRQREDGNTELPMFARSRSSGSSRSASGSFSSGQHPEVTPHHSGEFAFMHGTEHDDNRHTYFSDDEHNDGSYPHLRSRSDSFASGGSGDTVWTPDERDRSVGPADRHDNRPGTASSASSSSAASSMVHTEHAPSPRDSGPAEISIHAHPYDREYTPAPESVAYSFKSEFTSSSQQEVMQHENIAWNMQMNEFCAEEYGVVLEPDERRIRQLLGVYTAVPRPTVRGHCEMPSAISTPGTSCIDAFEDESQSGEDVSASMVSSPATNIPDLPELDRPFNYPSSPPS